MKRSPTFRRRVRAGWRRPQFEKLEARLALAALVGNPGFENSTLAPWFSFGPNPTITQVADTVRWGTRAALVEGRTESYQGIAQRLIHLVPDRDYELSVWVRLKPGAGESPVTDNVTLQVTVEDSAGTRFVNVATDEVASGAWTQLKGGIRLDASRAPTLVQVDVGHARPGTAYYVDQMVMREFDWRAAADALIETHRKRDAVLNVIDTDDVPLATRSIEVRQLSQEFGFGSALDGAALSNPQYADFFKRNFDWATSENDLKWRFTEPLRDAEDYAAADELVAFAESNGIRLRGHNIFWGTDNGLPDWIRNADGSSKLNPTELRGEVDERIDSLVTRYADGVAHWDVNNESLDLPFFEDNLNFLPGVDAHREMFLQARQRDSDGVLFTNEFGIIEGARHWGHEYRALVQRLLAAGAPVGGIGVEAHFDRGISSKAIGLGLAPLADLGLPIWLTEFDVLNPDVQDRAKDLELFYRTSFGTPQVAGVMMWGFWAGNHWRGADAALVDANWNLNAAGEKYLQLMDEWTTEVDGAGSQLAFRGFYGTYEARITLVDGTVYRRRFTLSSGTTNLLNLTVKLPFNNPATIVTTTADSGAGSLRAAIDFANDAPGRQILTFEIPGTGPHVIAPLVPLPQITDAITIDGTTQLGYLDRPVIVLDGSSVLGTNFDGITLATNGAVVRGLAVGNFPGDGIAVYGDNNEVSGTFVGISPSGTQMRNEVSGIVVERGVGNKIGSPGAPNVLAGNGSYGLFLTRLTSGNWVRNNHIGMSPTGTAPAFRQGTGIQVEGPNNVIGGQETVTGNFVANSSGGQIVLTGPDSVQNLLLGNRIGAALAGVPIGERLGIGVVIDAGARDNSVLDSLISGNFRYALVIADPESTGNKILRNRIGTNALGTEISGRQIYGVWLAAPANAVLDNIFGGNGIGVYLSFNATGNVIKRNSIGAGVGGNNSLVYATIGSYVGGAAFDNFIAENRIAHQRVGIFVQDSAQRNRIARNQIYDNRELAIDLSRTGRSLNDPGDADERANRLQNFPIVVSATVQNGNSLEITYRVDSLPANCTYPLRIEFFVNDAANTRSEFLAQDLYTAAQGATGLKTVTIPIDSAQWPADPVLFTTATDAANNTSEYSDPFPIVVGSAAFLAVAGRSSDAVFASDLDVNGDGHVTAIDALIVINSLNRRTANTEELKPQFELEHDVNGDNVLSPLDALLVINHVNQYTNVSTTIDLQPEGSQLDPTDEVLEELRDLALLAPRN